MYSVGTTCFIHQSVLWPLRLIFGAVRLTQSGLSFTHRVLRRQVRVFCHCVHCYNNAKLSLAATPTPTTPTTPSTTTTSPITTTPPPTPPTSTPTKSSNAGAIAGGVVGGVAVIAIIAALIAFF